MVKVESTIIETKCRYGYFKKVRNILLMAYVHRFVMNYGTLFILASMFD